MAGYTPWANFWWVMFDRYAGAFPNEMVEERHEREGPCNSRQEKRLPVQRTFANVRPKIANR